MALTRVYFKGELESEGFPVADVSDHLERDGTLVWVDVCNPTPEQMAELAEELGLHELAVEDALGRHQRPKVDHYPGHLFLACHSTRLNLDEGNLETTEIDAFINERWLITVRKDDGFDIHEVTRRWDRSSQLVAHGVSYLVYGLLDVVVDGYFDTVTRFDDYYDAISEGLFNEEPMELRDQRQWFQMRQALIKFHRLAVPMREAVNGLMRREQSFIDAGIFPYFQDVYDHVTRVNETTDALRDLIATLVETNLSVRDYRANQVMKKVTSWAAIIAVPTLITGWYGMNVPYPGLGRTMGSDRRCRPGAGDVRRAVPALPSQELAVGVSTSLVRSLRRSLRSVELVARYAVPIVGGGRGKLAPSPAAKRPACWPAAQTDSCGEAAQRARPNGESDEASEASEVETRASRPA